VSHRPAIFEHMFPLTASAAARDLQPRPPSPPDARALTERLGQLRREIAELTGAVPEKADSASVEAWLAAFRPVEGALAGLRARLIACVQASRAHDDAGHAGTTSFLREHLGVSGREAKKQNEMARDLRLLPQTRAALADGRIGAEQAQAIGLAARRGALGAPGATEQQLLPAAEQQPPDVFQRHIRREEQLADSRSLERAEQRAYRRRRASLARRQDGMWDLHALLPDEDGELLATALDAFRSADPPGTPPLEQRSPEQRTADALSDVIGASLRASSKTSGGVRPHLNVVVPVELLDTESSEVVSASHGGVLSSAALSRLLCDANLRRLLTRGDSEVLDVGRTKREWSVAQRVALHVRDGGCRAPGCDRPAAWTDAHHIVWWTKGGSTSVDNGILLCRRHHRMVHEGGWTVSLDIATASATFCSPAGREVVTHPHRSGDDGRGRGSRSSPASGAAAAAAVAPTQAELTLPCARSVRVMVRIDAPSIAREASASYCAGVGADHGWSSLPRPRRGALRPPWAGHPGPGGVPLLSPPRGRGRKRSSGRGPPDRSSGPDTTDRARVTGQSEGRLARVTRITSTAVDVDGAWRYSWGRASRPTVAL
jgi:hypothetical protein